MSGPEAAPLGKPKQLQVNGAIADRLAYYSISEDGGGVLAPRGWHCLNVNGSDGSFLVVAPHSLTAANVTKALQSTGFKGPTVILNFILGFTSGRDEVAPVIQRLFPAHMRFAVDAATMFDQPRPRYLGPYRADRLHYLSHEAVEFTTPAHRNGAGTLEMHLKRDGNPITGVHMLVRDNGDCCDLDSLAIRLSPADQSLAGVIRKQMERETGPVVWESTTVR